MKTKQKLKNNTIIPYSIDDLINIANNDHICKKQMKRSKSVELDYSTYRNNLPYNYNFHEYIFKNSTNTDYVIKLNDFPYNVESNIVHFVLWLQHTNYTHNAIQYIINEEFKGYTNVVWFINIPELRSIKTIYHAHVFVK